MALPTIPVRASVYLDDVAASGTVAATVVLPSSPPSSELTVPASKTGSAFSSGTISKLVDKPVGPGAWPTNGVDYDVAITVSGQTQTIRVRVNPSTTSIDLGRIDFVTPTTLGTAATKNVGTGSGTVAAGNDSRIVGALQASNNLSDLGSLPTAISNLGVYQFESPSDRGLKEWNYPIIMIQGGVVTVSGTLHLVKITPRKTQTVNNVHLILTSQGSGLTSNQNFVGVYDASGALLAKTADQSSGWASGSTIKNMALDSAVSLTAGTPVFVGILCVGSGPATFARVGTSAAPMNAGLTAANYAFAINGTSLTALPESITPGSNSGSSVLSFWAGLS